MRKIVSIHSYRGGTGKSNLTANLATAVALTGKRVGVVDTDIQSPGIHVLFGLDDKQITRAVNDYLYDQCEIQDVAYHVSPPEVTRAGGHLYLVPASMKSADIARVLKEGYDVEKLNAGFDQLLESLDLDFLFIDTHPGMNEETLLSIAISDSLILILRPDRQDYLGTAITIEVARKLGVPNLLLAVNKVLASMDQAALRKDVERSFAAEIGAVLLLSEDMLRLGSTGIFSLKFPDHQFTRAVAELATKLVRG
ncbi:ATPase involved in chromosome partitioning OS=Cylindrospermum stagnale PCC 7417 GN=Cylst_1905 PE=4 SV=1: CbiA [Gemmata massiliana]|uniref:AAA domain-containing protein n=1 Tax=Gemmata massiliana TaxID=1210884 RepID=A0A6P2CR68_9BACT|nr:MinD/ParA family protein [Gemmata massiliana]VTR91403.1 ATPase involved in chromosome partitioning OS=Cylindrospermum stagnale PCC 7417 GN=Cylst_1905 PE=4 SV=1: CbiA [Gemmata massiliana]